MGKVTRQKRKGGRKGRRGRFKRERKRFGDRYRGLKVDKCVIFVIIILVSSLTGA